jgi:dihydrofolate reductase
MDFGTLVAQFDTLLVGRRTFETMALAGRTTIPGLRTVVFSNQFSWAAASHSCRDRRRECSCT